VCGEYNKPIVFFNTETVTSEKTTEHILFITGKLAEKQLHQVLEEMQPTEFSYSVHQLGLKVAALMTGEMIQRRLKDTFGADRAILPGRCRGDLDALTNKFGIPFERGPDELKDLPVYFGKIAKRPDLSVYDLNIFAEITDAPHMSIDAILAQAKYYRDEGTDVIDIGCLPDTPFPHLEESIQALKTAGYQVSIDSLTEDDLLRGGKAGADFLLSLSESSLWIADEVAAEPVLIAETHGDLPSLTRAMQAMDKKGRSYYVDPILDPIHFGFTESIQRYYQVRQQHPQAKILMGVGNITELTHADTVGMNTIMLGICSELEITAILATQVSHHACTAIREADRARRIMYAARQMQSLPKHIDDGLMALHDTSPYPYNYDEIVELAAEIRDPSYRIQTTEKGIHIYNRDGLETADDPFDLFPKLDVKDDSGHAFYLGVQLGRAQLAQQLKKRFVQDEVLDWGCLVDRPEEDFKQQKQAGTTMKKSNSDNKKIAKDTGSESAT
jgi:dihydropteroate synthase